jgi:peptidyl-prolyl cis-trans isomerase C
MYVSMRSVLFSLALGAGVLGVAACSNGGNNAAKDAAAASGQSATDVGETLATVNGIVVGSKEFEQAAARKAPASGDSLSAEEKKEVLDQLVEEKLLSAEALRKGLDKDPRVQKVMVNTLLREDVYSTVKNSDFTDEMLQTYYEEHKSDFIVPEKVQIKRILIKVSDVRPDDKAKAEAERIHDEVAKAPDTFKDAAAKYSEDPYKRRGGDVGFVSKEGKPGLDSAIVDKAFSLQTNAISEVFKTADGYNIIQVAARREQVERTFQQMKGSVLRKVKNEKMKELYDAYVAKLRTGADVKIDEAKLASVEIKSTRKPFTPGSPLMGDGDEGEEGAGGGEPMDEEGGGAAAPGNRPGADGNAVSGMKGPPGPGGAPMPGAPAAGGPAGAGRPAPAPGK